MAIVCSDQVLINHCSLWLRDENRGFKSCSFLETITVSAQRQILTDQRNKLAEERQPNEGRIDMENRQTGGAETRTRLLNWSSGQAAAEGLSAQILRAEGFELVNPSHPLGGPDGLKDVTCQRDNLRWIGAAYFPAGQKPFREIVKKFRDDVEGVAANKADGIAFVTNQAVTVSERDKMCAAAGSAQAEVIHLERLTTILNSPRYYGVRLEYLSVQMTKEEQISYFAERDQEALVTQAKLQRLISRIEEQMSHPKAAKDTLSVELNRLKNLLAPALSGKPRMGFAALDWFEPTLPTPDQFQTLIAILEKLDHLMPSINGKLREFRSEYFKSFGYNKPYMRMLHGGLTDEEPDIQRATAKLLRYEQALDRVLAKQQLCASYTAPQSPDAFAPEGSHEEPDDLP